MIELTKDQLVFSFPDVHPDAKLAIELQRTLRIPDDDKTYPLPPGLGAFPLRHVDDHAEGVPPEWIHHGGVMMPMYQSEAMWLSFRAANVPRHGHAYPFAIKVATGKQCAISGDSWQPGLHRDPQNYMVAPRQPWLDGYVVEKGLIRQFVAMPLGSGYSAEEQLSGEAEHGGLQLEVVPMCREAFERRFPRQERSVLAKRSSSTMVAGAVARAAPDMGLSPGGRMRQEVFQHPYRDDEWLFGASSRCFVHLCNSLVWGSITGSPPPHPAPTASQYTKAGLPWYDYYDEKAPAVDGCSALAGMKSVAQLSNENGDVALPENDSVTPSDIVVIRKGLQKGQVREGSF